MAVIETWYNQDLSQPVNVHYLKGNVFSQDNDGNTIGVNVFENGEPASLSGTVSASIIRADGATVAVSGTLSDNKCYVTLPQAAYYVPGVLSIVIKLTSGTTVTTLCAVVANVYRSETDTTVDPGTIIPDISALIASIEDAIDSIPADYSSLLATIAADYSSSKTYPVVGTYAWYDGVLKRSIVPITTAESYTAAHWKNAVVGDDITDLKSALIVPSFGWTLGVLINSSGSFITGSSTADHSAVSDLIPVQTGDLIDVSGMATKDADNHAFSLWLNYFSNGVWLARQGTLGADNRKQIIPAQIDGKTVNGIRFSFTIASIDMTQNIINTYFLVDFYLKAVSAQMFRKEIVDAEIVKTKDIQIYTDFDLFDGWYTNKGQLYYNSGNTLKHTNKVKVYPNTDYYMAIKYDRGSGYYEGAFFDENDNFIGVLDPADLAEYTYQIPNGDDQSTLTNYVTLYKFTTPANAHYFSYNSTDSTVWKYRLYIANIPVYRHVGTGNLVLKKDDPIYQYYGKRKCCVIGPSTVMIDRLYRTGNFENDGESQSQYVVGFQEYLRPYWNDVVSFGYSDAAYAYSASESPKSIYTRVVTDQLDLSGYDDFVLVASGNGFMASEIGTVESYNDTGDNTTYIGALRQIIAYIYGQNPQAKVYIQTKRQYGAWFSSSSVREKTALLNAEIRKMAELISCKVIDMDSESGFNMYTATKWAYDSPTISEGGHWNHIGSREVGLITRKAIIGF